VFSQEKLQSLIYVLLGAVVLSFLFRGRMLLFLPLFLIIGYALWRKRKKEDEDPADWWKHPKN